MDKHLFMLGLLAANFGAMVAIAYVTILLGIQGYVYLIESNISILLFEIVALCVIIAFDVMWLVGNFRRYVNGSK
jgi:ABC-type nickel/cobalt efflux system permease component RcnA